MALQTPIDTLLADADLPNPADWDVSALLERYLSWPVLLGFALRIGLIVGAAFLSYRIVHVIPDGEIATVSNLTESWADGQRPGTQLEGGG